MTEILLRFLLELGCRTHFVDIIWLFAFVNYFFLAAARQLSVPDSDGQLVGLQALKVVAFAATPHVDFLLNKTTQCVSSERFREYVIYNALPAPDYQSKDNDEAVS